MPRESFGKGVEVPERKKQSWLVIVGWISGLGMTVAVSAYLGLQVGLWVDKKLDTEPFFLIFCIAIGLFCPFYGAYQKLLQTSEEEERPRRK